jgi:membrane fusion protein, multidrug efflux system
MKQVNHSIVMVVAIATSGATLHACSSTAADPSSTSPPPVPVKTSTVHYALMAQPVRASGVVANKAELRASFKTGGIVARVAVDEGQVVKRGQVLATLSSTEFDSGVEQATLAVTKYERDQRRVQQLFDGKAATREQLDDVTTGLSMARAQLRSVQFNRNHSVIVAPSNGRVTKRMVEPNELVAPGQPVMIMALDDAGWIVRGSVSDRSIVRLAVGDHATLSLQAFHETPLAATVSELAIAASPPLGTYEIELRLDAQAPSQLRAGMIADIALSPSTKRSLALIPASALRDGVGNKASVWTVQQGAVRRTPVVVAYFLGDNAAIEAGVAEGSQVVSEGAAYLVDNSQVSVQP